MSDEQPTDLPFRLGAHKILVIKDVPARNCTQCGEILLSDTVMERVDEIIDKIRGLKSELEVVRYAA